MKQIIIATKNPGKAKEFKEFFRLRNIDARSLLDLEEELPDIAETGATFEENAALKAEGICRLIGKPVLADDSGLVIDALDGRPGIHSARYAGEEKSDQANMEKVLEELSNTEEKDRSARFVCVLALARPNEKTIFATGYCEGAIAQIPTGDNGFGYDPIFVPTGYQKTMAELESEEKNQISHRKHAIEKLDRLIDQLF